MFIGIGLGLVAQAIYGGVGDNALNDYGTPFFLADFIESEYRNNGPLTSSFTALTGLSYSGPAITRYGTTPGGVLVPFAAGVPAIVPGRGLLIEGARTNLCLRSQEFDNASWTTSNGTLTPDAAVAPDGTTTADRLVGTAASSQGRVSQSIAGSIGATYTWSCYVNSAGGTLVRIYADDNATNIASVTYNTITGAVSVAAAIGGGNWTAVSSAAQQLGNGWWRFSLTFTATTVAPARFQVWHRDTSDGTSGIYIWGAQLEAAAFPSSYIPTTTTSVTRAADVCSIAVSGLAYPMTLFAEFERVVDTGVTETILLATDGTVNNYSGFFVTSGDLARAAMAVGAVTQANPIVAGALAVATSYRVAARFTTNSVQVAKGGVLGTEDTSATTPASPININLGMFPDGTAYSFGYHSEFAIIPGAFTDAQLQAVSS